MTKLDELTGKRERSIAILTLVREAMDEGGDAMTPATLTKRAAARFNPSFGEIGADEIAAAVEILRPIEFDPAEQDATVVKSDNLNSENGLVEVEAEPAMTRDEGNAELRDRVEALHEARTARMRAETAQRLAREKLAQAISEWNTGGPSPDAIRRNELRAINADRAAGQSPARNSRVHRSRIDLEAAYSTGGGAAEFVRKQNQNGSFHRPARLTADDSTPLVRPGKRGLIVTKLPSER
jgi:hypothetical protein